MSRVPSATIYFQPAILVRKGAFRQLLDDTGSHRLDESSVIHAEATRLALEAPCDASTCASR